MKIATLWTKEGRLFARFTYSAAAVAAIKEKISKHDRKWDPEAKMWHFDPSVRADVERVLTSFLFSIVDEDRRNDPAPVESNGHDPYATLARAAPFAALDKLYKATIAVAHPDRGGALHRAQEINAAWDAIKRERGT